eukprot:TRINITY_DN18638_c1_g1_i2.p1 TRINITY_DN18638_c1_g1~~TRINITY_DN18638_c1_g1_i2.p1  ORF type:complete len:433 (-),score=33.18 TRINITY_DN18638_c1_g1_i2:1112-2368(-)
MVGAEARSQFSDLLPSSDQVRLNHRYIHMYKSFNNVVQQSLMTAHLLRANAWIQHGDISSAVNEIQIVLQRSDVTGMDDVMTAHAMLADIKLEQEGFDSAQLQLQLASKLSGSNQHPQLKFMTEYIQFMFAFNQGKVAQAQYFCGQMIEMEFDDFNLEVRRQLCRVRVDTYRGDYTQARKEAEMLFDRCVHKGFSVLSVYVLSEIVDIYLAMQAYENALKYALSCQQHCIALNLGILDAKISVDLAEIWAEINQEMLPKAAEMLQKNQPFIKTNGSIQLQARTEYLMASVMARAVDGDIPDEVYSYIMQLLTTSKQKFFLMKNWKHILDIYAFMFAIYEAKGKIVLMEEAEKEWQLLQTNPAEYERQKQQDFQLKTPSTLIRQVDRVGINSSRRQTLGPEFYNQMQTRLLFSPNRDNH